MDPTDNKMMKIGRMLEEARRPGGKIPRRNRFPLYVRMAHWDDGQGMPETIYEAASGTPRINTESSVVFASLLVSESVSFKIKSSLRLWDGPETCTLTPSRTSEMDRSTALRMQLQLMSHTQLTFVMPSLLPSQLQTEISRLVRLQMAFRRQVHASTPAHHVGTENMNGCWSYRRFINEYDTNDPATQREKKREILECPNYKDFRKPPLLFNPYTFDMNRGIELLGAALESGNLVRAGMKSFVTPLYPDALTQPRLLPPKKGQSVVKTFDPSDAGGFWEETMTERRDRKALAACALYGKPSSPELVLKSCGGCRQILYAFTVLD
uniref:Uncharacterized protein n=1 Tax=Moniliophthora roreri TaxID=221103 RepID=A0A0W0FXA4_MONRR